MPSTPRRIALIAHDNCKKDLLEWARFNRGTLERHELYATGTTGSLLVKELGLDVTRFLSGPLGGDQQVGAADASASRTRARLPPDRRAGAVRDSAR